MSPSPPGHSLRGAASQQGHGLGGSSGVWGACGYGRFHTCLLTQLQHREEVAREGRGRAGEVVENLFIL